MYKTHCHLKLNECYDIVSNEKYKTALRENYNATKKVIKRINNETTFFSLFSDAVAFVSSITENESVVLWLNDNGYNSKLTFGLAHNDLVYSIVEQAKTNGVMYVNYEYWTVLSYYILALKNAPQEIYSFDTNNVFISATLAGSNYSLLNEQLNGTNIYLETAINGMYTYLRFLFTANILLNGKSYDVVQLSNWKRYDINNVFSFLLNFDHLMTTNYDMLLEKITKRQVSHLHGYYSKKKKRVLSQSLGVFYNLVRYDLSTAVIGDYFLSKSFLQIVSKIAAKQPQNSNIEIYGDILKRVIEENRTEIIVIFGLNMDNDFRILRDIQIYLEAAKIKSPDIVYCYFNENDKNSFINGYDACITYSKELCDYIRNNIKVSVLDSKQLIEKVFVSLNND